MPSQAFCIGCKASYDKALLTPPVYKLGCHDDYFGGGVWQYREEAQAFLEGRDFERFFPGRGRLEFGIYPIELQAPWLEATHHLGDEPFRRLIKDALIICP